MLLIRARTPPGAVRCLICASVVFVYMNAAAQQLPPPERQPLPENIYHIGGDVKPPFLIQKQEPAYSEEARIARLEGTVMLLVTISEHGQPRDFRVLRPLGLGLDEAAIAAVSAWRFKPATKQGNPVAVQATIEVNFRLLSGDAWHLARVVFHAPAGASRPIITKTEFPKTSDPDGYANVALSFDVNAQGMPVGLHVDRSSDPNLNAEILAVVIDGWRFRPGARDGQLVAVRCTLDFARGEMPPVPAPR